ncbi:zf-TFIIB domain-containing protein [bacterium]|nr:zf-TFIIB domain-containing protein [bacterium]
MSDTKEIINCPACGKPMEKVLIPSANINIDICTEGCGGIFFDNREFDKFNEEHEDISALIDKLKGKKYAPAEKQENRLCPVCEMKMVQNKSCINGEISVDECYCCGGKFLDFGELEKIRAEYASDRERSKAALDYLMREKGEELALESMERLKDNRTMLQKLFFWE